MVAIKHFTLLQVICFVVTLVAATSSLGANGNAIPTVTVSTNQVKSTATPAHAPASAASTPVASTVTTHVQVKGTTVAPSKAPAVVAKLPTVSVTHAPVAVVPTAAASTSSTPAQKLTAYFEPICSQISKLKPKHTFKIQSQLKQFIEKTSGKMSACFMHHYAINPNLSPVSTQQLDKICASRATNSFKQFLDCAAKNWDAKLDTELDRISAARANCLKKHDHSKDDEAMHLAHDEEDKVLINNVVSKVLGDSHGQANVKLIDLGLKTGTHAASAAGTKTAAAGAVAGAIAGAMAVAGSHSKHPTAAPANPIAVMSSTRAPQVVATSNNVTTKKLLNEPNATIVFVDGAKSNAATVIPSKTTAKPATASGTTTPPAAKAAKTTASPGTIISNSTVVVTIPPTPKGTTTPGKTTVHPTSKHHPASSRADKIRDKAPAAKTVSKDLANKDAASEDPASKDAASKDAVSKDAASKTSSSKDTAIKSSDSKSSASKDTASKSSAGKDSASKTPASKDAASKVAVSKDAASKTSASKDAASKGPASKDASSKTPASKDAASKGAAIKDTATKGSDSKSPASKETASKTSANKDAASKTPANKDASSKSPATKTSSKASADGSLKDSIAEKEKKIKELARESLMKVKEMKEKMKKELNDDKKLHKLEHDRQMAKDPIGHTEKHKQYELNKKKALAAAKTGASAGTKE